MNEAFEKIKPEVIINTIAETSIDKCEKYPNRSYYPNVIVAKNIRDAKYVGKETPQLIQISTDQVYSGEGPHNENEMIRPINKYGEQKYEAEQLLYKRNEVIIRTNIVGKSYSEGRNSLTDWIIKSGKEKKKIYAFEDIFFSPLTINRVSKYINAIIGKKTNGIYNLAARDKISKADFIKTLYKKMGYCEQDIETLNSERKLSVSRPKDMSMATAKVEALLNDRMPSVTTILEEITNEYK